MAEPLTEAEPDGRDEHLDAPVVRRAEELVHRLPRRRLETANQIFQYALARAEVDGAPVVGVDQMKRPRVRALIEIGHTGGRQLEDGLGDRIEEPRELDAAAKGGER